MLKSRRDFETEVVAKFWSDDAFAKRCRSNPKEVVEELSGEKLPKDMEVRIVEETAKSVCIVIPRNPDEELSMAELEQIAGGVRLGPAEQKLYRNNIFTRLK